MTQSVSQLTENVHVDVAFIVAHARTRDFDYAKSAADSAARNLAQLASALPGNTPFASDLGRLRSIVDQARKSLARQQQPDGVEQGLELIIRIDSQLEEK